VRWRLPLVGVLAALAASTPAANAATNECHGIQQCISVPGPWVVVPAHGQASFLLSCPGGRSVVGGTDAQVTSRDVHVGFDARLGAPVQPGVSTTRYAFFRAWSTSSRAQMFQPRLGCIPVQGGGGRSTVSARVSPPGASLEYRARVVVIGPGLVKFASARCQKSEQLVGAWNAVAFRTKKPPPLVDATLVRATRVVLGSKVVVTAAATDRLSIDAHAVVQVGAECAP
jgi:hypothetical protein